MSLVKILIPYSLRKSLSMRFHNPYSEVEDKNHIIFVHIPKTAGKAIFHTLFSADTIGHHALVWYKTYNETKFNDYYKFAIVRNPWDRIVSAFYYLKQGGMIESDKAFALKHLGQYDNFADFVRGLEIPEYRRKILRWIHFIPQCYFLCEESGGSLMVDFLGKYETIDDDLKQICEHLRMRYGELEFVNKSDHRPYWEYYDRHTVEIVRDLYRRDIELFDYEFPYDMLKK